LLVGLLVAARPRHCSGSGHGGHGLQARARAGGAVVVLGVAYSAWLFQQREPEEEEELA